MVGAAIALFDVLLIWVASARVTDSKGRDLTVHLTANESAISRVLATSWASFGLLAWLSTCAGLSAKIPASSLTLLAAVVFAIGIGLKQYSASMSDSEATTDTAIDVLLCTVGNVNWFGCLTAFSENLREAVPLMILFVLAESLTFGRLRQSVTVAWSQLVPRESQGEWPGLSVFSSAVSGDLLAAGADASQELSRRKCADGTPSDSTSPQIADAFSPVAEADDVHQGTLFAGRDGMTRQTVEGVDEQQRRYLSGSVVITMPPRQSMEEVVVGFCPAFEGDPQVEIEVDHEEVAARAVTCTPAGMRVQLRRSISAEPLDVILEWYAAQRGDGFADPAGQRVLP